MTRYRRGTITTPTQADVVNIEWDENNEYDRTQVDSELAGKPVLMRKQGSGSFELTGGVLPTDRYGQNMVMAIEDVSVATATETLTSRIATFTDVTFNRGARSANDGSRGGGRVQFEFGTVTLT